ncbi:hypothetical protein EVAR_56613_1 [Eumeta japonica]|uniref:Uncharacterized protein n=1 Tax=Eumeta variegata TaxID=151549 RepID=A0A4C1XJR7_EUMVA|nr:hypothetical protein EVAR_56613_1 [Eumeta japonica]
MSRTREKYGERGRALMPECTGFKSDEKDFNWNLVMKLHFVTLCIFGSVKIRRELDCVLDDSQYKARIFAVVKLVTGSAALA